MNGFNEIADAVEKLAPEAYRALSEGEPHDLDSAFQWLETHGAQLSQRELKSHSNRYIRRANLIRKRMADAHLAEQAAERFASRALTRMEILAEMMRQAAGMTDPKERDEAKGAIRDMVRGIRRAERAEADTPLYVLRSPKHDAASGSRAIRRKVRHDWLKGRKPAPGKGRGSVPLAAADLIELHGRFAAPVLGADVYNEVLACS